LVPIAPELVEPGEGGRAIGTVMSGLLLGVLLGRTASGVIGQALGWRAVVVVGHMEPRSAYMMHTGPD
jgi:predicted MFS family arabinose efflux permease